MTTECDHSATLGALAEALGAAQAMAKDAKKDASNPGFKGSRYATLASVREAVTPALTTNGLAVTQTFEPHGDAGVCVVTTLLHKSGEWIRSRLFVPVTKKDAQGFGSAISYGRRYSLAAIVGIASDDDDDAEAAVGRNGSNGAAKPTAKTEGKPESDEAEKLLATLFDKASTADALADVSSQAVQAVKSGALTEAARNRLRKKMAEATTRVSAASAA